MRSSVALVLASVIWCSAARAAEPLPRAAAVESAGGSRVAWKRRLAPMLSLSPGRLLPRGLFVLPDVPPAGPRTWSPSRSVAPAFARTDGGFQLSLSGSF